MSPTQEIDVHDIDHLGIIAGLVDEIGIVTIIDELLGPAGAFEQKVTVSPESLAPQAFQMALNEGY